MVVYSLEGLSTYLEDCEALWQAHMEEVKEATGKNYVSVDIKKYKELYESGNLLVITARENEELVGYCLVALGNDLNFSLTKVAHVTMYYVKPIKRRGEAYLKLFNTLENEAKERGIHEITVGEKLKLRTMLAIFTKLGYNATELHYAKSIAGA